MDAGQGFGPLPWPGDRRSGEGLERVSWKSSGPRRQQAAEVSVPHPRPTLAEARNPRTPLPRQPPTDGILPSLSPPPPSSPQPGPPWPQGSRPGRALAWYTVPRRQLVPLPFLVFAHMRLRTPYSELPPLYSEPPLLGRGTFSLLYYLVSVSLMRTTALWGPGLCWHRARCLKHKCLLSE